MANPFYYDSPAKPNDFVGRARLVATIADNLCSLESKSHGIVGGRRFGKSSVLAALQRDLEQRLKTHLQQDFNVFPVSISLHKATSPMSANDMLGYLLHSIRQTTCGPKPPPPFRGGPLLDLGLPVYTGVSAPASFDDLESGIVDIIGGAYPVVGTLHLALLIDEVEAALDQPWTAGLFGNLRSLIYDSRVADYVRIVVAGSGRFLGSAEKGSPLLNVLEKWELEPLDAPAIRALTGKAQGLDGQVADEVLRQAGGHPFIAQYLLHHLWEIGNAQARQQDVLELADRFRDVDRANDVSLWWSSGLGQDGRLAYMALSQGSDWMSITEVRDAVADDEFQPARGLRALVCHGFAVHDGRWRKYSASGQLFRAWAEPLCQLLRQRMTQRAGMAVGQSLAPGAINTGGGAAVGGSATVGKDFIGRDQYINNYYLSGGAAQVALQADLAKSAKLRPIVEILEDALQPGRVQDAVL